MELKPPSETELLFHGNLYTDERSDFLSPVVCLVGVVCPEQQQLYCLIRGSDILGLPEHHLVFQQSSSHLSRDLSLSQVVQLLFNELFPK